MDCWHMQIDRCRCNLASFAYQKVRDCCNGGWFAYRSDSSRRILETPRNPEGFPRWILRRILGRMRREGAINQKEHRGLFMAGCLMLPTWLWGPRINNWIVAPRGWGHRSRVKGHGGWKVDYFTLLTGKSFLCSALHFISTAQESIELIGSFVYCRRLNHNQLQFIPDSAFTGLDQLQRL